MRLPIGKLVSKAFKWLIPHITDEVVKEIARRETPPLAAQPDGAAFLTDDVLPSQRDL